MELKPGYKQTEIGPVPEDWDIKKIGDFADPVRGSSPRPAGDPKYFNGSFIPWLTVAGLTSIPEAQLVVDKTETFLTENGSTYSRILHPETVIIANSGATLGVAKILGIKCCANDGIAALLGLGEDTSSRFLAHYINSRTTHLREAIATGNGQPNLNTTLIRNINVPLPPTKSEQLKIAEALSDVDMLIESLDLIIVKKRLIKQGAMWELLTGRRRLPGFDDPRETKRLSYFGSFLRGAGVTKSQASRGDLPCIRYGEIYTRHENFIREFWSWISRETSLTATRLMTGDILFAGSGETKEEIGKSVAFLDDVEAYAGGDIIILRLNDKADPLFFGYYLNTPMIAQQKTNVGQGDAVVHIGMGALANVIVQTPQIEEQVAIGKVLYSMDAEIITLQSKLDKARRIKQGMVQELLSGRIRLVSPGSNVVHFRAAQKGSSIPQKGHNSAINEAVIISVLAKKFGSDQYPLGRKRYTKLSYLFHRHADGEVEGYLEKAAGPYNPSTKYKGAEKIALSNRYVRSHARDNFSGFVAAEKIAEAEGYFTKWYGGDAISWLEQFRYKKNDELELLATVDKAMLGLREADRTVDLESVKQYIQEAPEWTAKLGRSIFSDENIEMAIKWSQQLFEA